MDLLELAATDFCLEKRESEADLADIDVSAYIKSKNKDTAALSSSPRTDQPQAELLQRRNEESGYVDPLIDFDKVFGLSSVSLQPFKSSTTTATAASSVSNATTEGLGVAKSSAHLAWQGVPAVDVELESPGRSSTVAPSDKCQKTPPVSYDLLERNILNAEGPKQVSAFDQTSEVPLNGRSAASPQSSTAEYHTPATTNIADERSLLAGLPPFEFREEKDFPEEEREKAEVAKVGVSSAPSLVSSTQPIPPRDLVQLSRATRQSPVEAVETKAKDNTREKKISDDGLALFFYENPCPSRGLRTSPRSSHDADLEEGPRAPANVDPTELEDYEKKSIYVVYEGSCTPVSWFADTPIQDVKEMILCACDAIIDGGFVMREVHLDESDAGRVGLGSLFAKNLKTSCDSPSSSTVQKRVVQLKVGDRFVSVRLGRVYDYEDFGELQDRCLYMLEPGQERSDLKPIIGDRWRRLQVSVPALQHVEAQKGIARMRKGANLLKQTHSGFPHLRQFQLTSDGQRLVWYSGIKKELTTVHIKTIRDIKLGQSAPLFQRYRLPMLEHLSFSIYYDARPSAFSFSRANLPIPAGIGASALSNCRTLDLTCKDECEFDFWVAGLKALVAQSKEEPINKIELLKHSRRFRNAVQKNMPGVVLPQLFSDQTQSPSLPKLEDCIELPFHSPLDLESKLTKLKGRIIVISHQLKPLVAEMSASTSSTTTTTAALSNVQKASEEKSCTTVGNETTAPHSEAQPTQLPPSNQFSPELSFFADSAEATPASAILRDMTDAQDRKMEVLRMQELLQMVADLLNTAQKKLSSTNYLDPDRLLVGKSALKVDAKDGESKEQVLKRVNQILWKAEVDIENLEDMYNGLMARDSQDPSEMLSQRLAKLNSQMSGEIQKFGDQLYQKFSRWFAPREGSPRFGPTSAPAAPFGQAAPGLSRMGSGAW